MAVIGIDLGTTNSLAVAYIDDAYKMIPNAFDEYLTPSVVSVDDNGNIIVGKLAQERLVTHSEQSASLFKRKMGSSEKIKLGKHMLLPEELSAFVVKQLIEDAERFLKQKVNEVVISVPAYFSERQRNATKRIGEILGVKVERLINEPSAAALACHNLEKDEAFIVFDFGGGTLDVTVVDCFDNVTSICSIAGDNHLGGSDFDLLIAQDFCLNNNLAYDDLSLTQQEALLMQCEKLKIRLQKEEKIEINLFVNGTSYMYTLDKELMKSLSNGIFTRIRKVIAQAVNNSGLEKDEFEKMILVGGSCYMNTVIEYLQENMNIPLVLQENRDMLVVEGLGIYIGIKQRCDAVKHLVLTDICPFSLSTSINNEQNPANPLSDVIISKNTVLPTSKSKVYHATNLGQEMISVEVYQGEALYANENTLLGKTDISIPCNKTKHEMINVTYSYDINSMLCVEVQVLSTGEVHRYYVSEGRKLETMHSQFDDFIKNASLKLSKEPEIELIHEKANRLCMLGSPNVQESIKKLMKDFEIRLHSYENNLRKKKQLIMKVKDILNQLEDNLENSSVFVSDEDDGDIYLS